MEVGSAGLTWVVSVGLFAYLGYLLDQWIGSLPCFVVLGSLMGAIGGGIHFFSRVAPEVLPFGRKPKADDDPTDSSHQQP